MCLQLYASATECAYNSMFLQLFVYTIVCFYNYMYQPLHVSTTLCFYVCIFLLLHFIRLNASTTPDFYNSPKTCVDDENDQKNGHTKERFCFRHFKDLNNHLKQKTKYSKKVINRQIVQNETLT